MTPRNFLYLLLGGLTVGDMVMGALVLVACGVVW